MSETRHALIGSAGGRRQTLCQAWAFLAEGAARIASSVDLPSYEVNEVGVQKSPKSREGGEGSIIMTLDSRPEANGTHRLTGGKIPRSAACQPRRHRLVDADRAKLSLTIAVRPLQHRCIMLLVVQF